MSALVKQALSAWGLEGAEWSFIAHRENTIYRVAGPAGDLALRVHRAGYRTDAELASELQWMAAVAAGGASVPAPMTSARGHYLEHIDGQQVDVLSWLPGEMLGTRLANSGPAGRATLMQSLGQAAARLHEICDAWTPPHGFTRPNWDAAGLVGAAPVWGRFWDAPWLSDRHHGLFSDFRDIAEKDLSIHVLDEGLIHADLLGENVLVDGADIRFIDFDDGGYGFRLFELTTALIRQVDTPDYVDLRAALFEGYQSVRRLDSDAFDLLLALRATTYIGWIADRPDLPDAQTRQAFNTDLADRLIMSYLANR